MRMSMDMDMELHRFYSCLAFLRFPIHLSLRELGSGRKLRGDLLSSAPRISSMLLDLLDKTLSSGLRLRLPLQISPAPRVLSYKPSQPLDMDAPIRLILLHAIATRTALTTFARTTSLR
jgi:hypothetical protein